MKDIAEHILDITQNSIRAKASLIEIKIHQSTDDNYYQLIIIDNGVGMDKDTIQQVIDPFYTSRTTRKVGLGIPLLKQNAEITGGTFSIISKLGEGTHVQANFVYDSIDRVPEGDIAGSFVLLVASNALIDFEFEYATNRGNYVFDTREVKKVLGDMSFSQLEIRTYLIEMIKENIFDIV
ncbi:MAG: ATP-binding protein [Salinivirgaceae bacterium]|jgi:hypothetical protein|nr:ATP-binding protein [Salinivirgaceae bacterium]